MQAGLCAVMGSTILRGSLFLVLALLAPPMAYGQSIITQETGNTLRTPQLLTSASGNFTVPSGVTLLRGTMTGAGGGGGGVSAATATGASGIPGVMLTFMMVVTPGQVIAYTNGAGGTRGANTGGNGGAGGDSTFGTLTAKGGLGGVGSTSGNASVTNPTGSGSFSVAIITGSAAVPTTSTAIIAQSGTDLGGTGGSAGVGGTGRGIWGSSTPGTNGSATDCVGYGAAGSGAGSTTNTAGTGALGCPGAILLY